MATLLELITRCSRVIQDDSYSSEIIRLLNRGVKEVCRGVRMPDLSVTPPMPGLHVMAEITTDAVLPYASLPDDFQRDLLFLAHAESKSRIHVETSFLKFLKKFPGLNETGTVSMASVKGSRLYYQGIPGTPETLYIHYYRLPAVLVNDTDVPEGIPEELHEEILIPYVAWKLFSEIEQGLEGHKIDTNWQKQRYYEALHDLTGIIPIDGEPVIYEDSESASFSFCLGERD